MAPALRGFMEKRHKAIRLLLTLALTAQSQTLAQSSPQRLPIDMNKPVDINIIRPVAQKSLNFLVQTQFKQADKFYQAGEFPTEMKTYLIPSLVGLGKSLSRPTQEPTAFVTSTIINLTTEAYLLDPTLKGVNSLIDLGLPSLDGYRKGDVFHYYPEIEFNGLRIHAPKDPAYVPRKMLSLALVPPDADTTSVSYTALAFADLMRNKKPVSQFQIPEKTLQAWTEFRDLNRDPHPYNRAFGTKNSGAFLTWLWDENAKSSSFLHSIQDKPDKGYRIVFGRNDVDCVVNANVLRLLTLTNNQNHSGYSDTCQYLNDMILKKQAKSCGIYYPNTFNPLYTISSAYKAGASCLSQTRNQAVRFIVERQNPDGSWSNDEGMSREDKVQSTAWALSALLNYADTSDRSHENTVHFAVRYLLSQARFNGAKQIYWPGEVFFSGSAAARNTILWRSDSYTTALVLLSLKKAEAYLKNEVSR